MDISEYHNTKGAECLIFIALTFGVGVTYFTHPTIHCFSKSLMQTIDN